MGGRAAGLRDAAAAGLGAPFALFLNADAGALEHELPELPLGGATLVMEITETALTERPEMVLRTLTALRRSNGTIELTLDPPITLLELRSTSLSTNQIALDNIAYGPAVCEGELVGEGDL